LIANLRKLKREAFGTLEKYLHPNKFLFSKKNQKFDEKITP
jgi:hypothetical protein